MDTQTAANWLSLALVTITAFYAWATFRMLKANRDVVALMEEQLEAQTRPYVLISSYIREGTILLYLSIKNSGRMPARNLRLSIDPPFYQMGSNDPSENLANFSAFSQPIESLAPNAEIHFFLATGPVIFGPAAAPERTPKVFTITAEYEFLEKKVSERTTIDLRPYLNTEITHNPIADEIEKLRKAVEKLGDKK